MRAFRLKFLLRRIIKELQNCNYVEPLSTRRSILYIGLILLSTLLLSITVLRAHKNDSLIILNRAFYSNFIRMESIKRDFFLDNILNRIFQGKGYVDTVENFSRYNKKFRIVIRDSEALNLNIRYNIFTDKSDYFNMLKKSDIFEFKGQFIIYTPLNSRRDAYIFDIILIDGALVVE